MVKLVGPGLGASATGSLAGKLTFSSWHGKAYLKTHASPAQPRSAPQIAMRAILAFLSGEWTGLSIAQKATWEALAHQTNISPFNAFNKTNLARWRNYEAPTKAYPATGTLPTVSNPDAQAIAIERGIRIRWHYTAPIDLWGTALHHLDLFADPATWNTLIYIRPGAAAGWKEWIWRPLEPGQYHVLIRHVSEFGGHWQYFSKRTATVT